MDFEDYQFKGLTGYFLALFLVIFSPVIMAWGAAMDIMNQCQEEEGRILYPNEQLIFYCLGVYAASASLLGIVALGYLVFFLVSWSASMISSS